MLLGLSRHALCRRRHEQAALYGQQQQQAAAQQLSLQPSADRPASAACGQDNAHVTQLPTKTSADITAEADRNEAKPVAFSAAKHVLAQKESAQPGKVVERHGVPQQPQTHSSMPKQQQQQQQGSERSEAAQNSDRESSAARVLAREAERAAAAVKDKDKNAAKPSTAGAVDTVIPFQPCMASCFCASAGSVTCSDAV